MTVRGYVKEEKCVSDEGAEEGTCREKDRRCESNDGVEINDRAVREKKRGKERRRGATMNWCARNRRRRDGGMV